MTETTPPKMEYEIDRSPSLVVESVVLARAGEDGKDAWTFSNEDGRLGVQFVPMTWTTPPDGMPASMLALVCCPNCRGVMALARGVHAVDPVTGRVRPDLIHKKCGFHRRVHLDRWNRKPLYACAIERRGRDGRYHPEVTYCSADTQDEARFHLGLGDYRIVAVGRAIGFFASKDGREVGADLATADAPMARFDEREGGVASGKIISIGKAGET
jgi:hypothetical protein